MVSLTGYSPSPYRGKQAIGSGLRRSQYAYSSSNIAFPLKLKCFIIMYLQGPVFYFHSIGYNQFQRQFVEQRKGFSIQADS